MNQSKFIIIGGGLAGCECALLLAEAGFLVELYEQKPLHFSPAHTNENLGELVCSNSFRSDDANSSGIALLKEELRFLASPLMQIAEKVKVPAGKALAVDRTLFAEEVTKAIHSHENIQLIHKEITSLDDIKYEEASKVIIATGPLTSPSFAQWLGEEIGGKKLYFYDAIAPIILTESIDMSFAFYGSRYGNDAAKTEDLTAADVAVVAVDETESLDTIIEENEGDYINCPMNKEEYHAFWEALVEGERVPSHDFEEEVHFEGCMPIEALADRGEKTLSFGPLKPVGFIDPRTGHRPWAIVQLRAENKEGTAYNLVGCQTKLTYKAQDKVFRLIPALHNTEFLRYGSVHRNTYLDAPLVLNAELSLKSKSHVYFAGQITGVEGYVESIASALWLAKLLIAKEKGLCLCQPPQTTALGGLLTHLQTVKKNFQPSNAHFGLMTELGQRAKKKERKALLAQRAKNDFQIWKAENTSALL